MKKTPHFESSEKAIQQINDLIRLRKERMLVIDCLAISHILNERDELLRKVERLDKPLNLLIFCPNCHKQHVDKPEPDICECGHNESEHYEHRFEDYNDGCSKCSDRHEFEIAWTNPPHKSHTCRLDYGGCGLIFRIADVPTNGVEKIQTGGKDDTWFAAQAAQKAAEDEALEPPISEGK